MYIILLYGKLLLCTFFPCSSPNAFPLYFSLASITPPDPLHFYPEQISGEKFTLVRGYCSNSVPFQSFLLIHVGTYWNMVCVKDTRKLARANGTSCTQFAYKYFQTTKMWVKMQLNYKKVSKTPSLYQLLWMQNLPTGKVTGVYLKKLYVAHFIM